MTAEDARPRVLFVNGGILGLLTFHKILRAALPGQSAITGDHIVLTADLTAGERVLRRAMCARLWVDSWLGAANLDLARFRRELHAGVQARRRIAARRGSFDVLHFHRQATAYASLGMMRRVPSIVSVDCTQECVLADATSAVERASYTPNVRRDGAVFRRASAIVAVSKWAADSIRRMYPDCTTPVHVMPNPVMLDQFDPAWMEARRARAAAGEKPHLLFMGGDFPRKGGYELLRAWTRGGFAGRATLELVTDWRIPAPLPRGVTRSAGVAAHSAEWRARWARADAFVLPTKNEAFGIVFQEAAASGIPAIGTRHNAVPEIVRDGETGLLVPRGDEDALIHAMDTLIRSAGVRHQLGSNARRVIEELGSPDRYLAALSGIVLDAYARRHE